MIKKILLIITAVIATISYAYATPVSINGKLKVAGLQLVNECGYPIQLRGVSSHGIQWFGSCYNADSLDYIADTLHADVFRIALYVSQADSGYRAGPAYFTNMVNSLVDLCESRGMYAIIDWHISNNDGDPNTDITYAETFWQAMATAHKGKKHVLYEICNEPTVNWATIRTYADTIIPLIRAIDPDTIIIVGTPNWSQLGSDVVANKFPTTFPYNNIMYTFHFYAGSHNTGMLTPYVGALPIFCTEWAASNADGGQPSDPGLNTANANNFISVMAGNNSSGQKISWASWSFSEKAETSAQLLAGSCDNGPFTLSPEGVYVKNWIMTPGKTFVYCSHTITPTFTPSITGTPPTHTVTPTITMTPTITLTLTALPFQLIYDGDTAGARLADGTPISNSDLGTRPTPVGTITEATGGNPGKAMKLVYISPNWWMGHTWVFPAKTVGEFNNIMLDVKAVNGSVANLLYWPDTSVPVAGRVNLNSLVGGIDGTWRSVMIPLNKLYVTVPATINTLRFVANANNTNYTVLIDNVKLVMVPSATVTPTFTLTYTSTETLTITNTPTITETHTITQTHTITPTFTVTPTVTVTPTYVPGLVFKGSFTYPNPSKGDKITFRYRHTGFADTVKIKVYTFSDRKIAEIMDGSKYGEPYDSETVWTPPYKLGMGLYYYTIELTGSKKTVTGKIGTFVILRM